jgi:hypothetical protein
VTPPGAQDQPDASRLPAWLRGGGAREPAETRPLGALRDRFHGRFESNGRAVQPESEAQAEPRVPGPRRSAAPARARAGATVAARRSPAELWALRVVAALVVAVLLTAFVLILAYFA